METQTKQTQSMTIYTNGLEIVQTGKNKLIAHETAINKALDIGNTLLKQIEANDGKLTPELDAKLNQYIAQCNKRLKELKENRAPVTQILDQIKKLFTTKENEIDHSKGGVVKQLMDHRQKYAQQLHEEEQERKRIAQAKLDKEEEMSSCLAEATKQLKSDALEKAHQFVVKNQSYLDNMTLEAKEDVEAKLKKNATYGYTQKSHDAFVPTIFFKYNTQEEFDARWDRQECFDDLKKEIDLYMQNGIQAIVDKIPSHITFLQEKANADEAEKKRLEEEQKKRQEEAEAERKKKADEKQAEIEEKAKMQASSGSMNAMFNNAQAEVQTPKPETRSGYELIINSTDGYAEIFAFWMQKEGIALSKEAIQKTTIAKMMKFACTYAHKHDEQIKSNHLEYKATIKVVNRLNK